MLARIPTVAENLIGFIGAKIPDRVRRAGQIDEAGEQDYQCAQGIGEKETVPAGGFAVSQDLGGEQDGRGEHAESREKVNGLHRAPAFGDCGESACGQRNQQ